MEALTGLLYREYYKDAKLASILTHFELPNLMEMLLWLQERATPESVISLADTIETLASHLDRKSALRQAVRVREKTALKLSDWSHASYLTESATIDRLLEQADLPAAHVAAQQLLRRSMEAGVGAYPQADYDIAMAHFSLGRVLKNMGQAEAALQPLGEAQRRFEDLARNQNVSAEGMQIL